MIRITLLVLIFLLGCSSSVETYKSGTSGEINVYVNKSADKSIALENNYVNSEWNLEDQLIERISNAEWQIDMAAYEINLPKLIDSLISKASQGVKVRFIIDAKDGTEDDEIDPNEKVDRYTSMRLNLERMKRGKDNIHGTQDDIQILADSPIFAVTDTTLRKRNDLPVSYDDYDFVTVKIGTKEKEGYLLIDSERKEADFSNLTNYYSPGYQMHNKFVIVDYQWVFTGSWNFTVTGLYGNEWNMERGILDGNQQHVVEIKHRGLANIYTMEFNEMWGSKNYLPDPSNSKFHTRKRDNTPKEVYVDSTRIEVYFSPSDGVLDKIYQVIEEEADSAIHFSIFAFSDQRLVDLMKYKWENNYNDLEGERTGFKIKGLFDRSFWNQWWSASIDMTGRTAKQTSPKNPNIRWKHPAPVYRGRESRKLHSKTMIIDDDVVIVGSANWSENADSKNDENTLIIYNKKIANQFLQEFYARYKNASSHVKK